MQNWDNYSLRDELKSDAELTQLERYQRAAYFAKVEQLLDSKLKPGERLLDIGCGIGRWVRYMLDRGVDCEGIDFSEAALEKARSVLAEKYAERQVVRFGNATKLDFANESFDAIISFGLI